MTFRTRYPLLTANDVYHALERWQQTNIRWQQLRIPKYFSFLRVIYCCLFLLHSGLIPTHTACFPTTFKSHTFQLTTSMAQWTYSTVLHFQNILLIYFPLFLLSPFFLPPLPPPPQGRYKSLHFCILNEELYFHTETISQAEVLYSLQ